MVATQAAVAEAGKEEKGKEGCASHHKKEKKKRKGRERSSFETSGDSCSQGRSRGKKDPTLKVRLAFFVGLGRVGGGGIVCRGLVGH